MAEHGPDEIIPAAHAPGIGGAGGDGGQEEELILELTPAQQQAELDRVSQPLRDQLIPAACFSLEGAITAGFSFKGFFKLVKNVASLQPIAVLEEAIALGGQKRFWRLHTRATREEFVRFARWLKEKEGQDALYGIQRTERLKRKARPHVTPSDLALLQIFDQMRQDYISEAKAVRSRFEGEIAELQGLLRMKKREMEQSLEGIKARFHPASSYNEPLEEDVGRTAWELYNEECQRQNKRIKVAGAIK